MTRNEITAVYDNVARQTKPFAKERLREFVVYFAELIAELERNECAEICEDLHHDWHFGEESGPRACKRAILDKGKQQ